LSLYLWVSLARWSEPTGRFTALEMGWPLRGNGGFGTSVPKP
jgi:hypothetical protein